MITNLDNKIIELERELLNLKQIYGINNVKGYMYETTIEGHTIYPTWYAPMYKITFKPSDGELITYYESGLFTPIPMKIDGNVQYLQSDFIGGKVFIFSSWEVEKVEKIT